MNDAERDAWLREALRHAPDADALPPSGVSESILLKARAAARATPAAARRREPRATTPTNAFGRFWAWLARPAVAGAFASVMAATLVGLMWWDRPMDETVAPPPPATTSDRRVDAPRPDSKSAPATVAPLSNTAPLAPPAPAPGTSPAPTSPPAPAAVREVARAPAPAPRAKALPEPETMRDAKVAPTAPAPATAPPAPLAKERAAPEALKSEAPAPFPATESQRRERLVAQSLDAAKKDSGAARRADADSRPPAAAANVAEADALRRADVATGGAAATGEVRAQATAPAEKLQRQRAADDERGKSVAGFAAAAPAPFRSAPAPAQPDAGGRAASPLANVLAAIAADPGAWSRRTAGGDSFALEPGWRAWLNELDAAAAGRWRALGAGPTGETSADRGGDRDGATTLRLVAGGSVAAVVRVEGTTVRVELPGGAGRWQASLGADAGERVRSAAQRLPR